MSYVAIAQDLPRELQMPILRLVETVRSDMRDELAVRRQDFDELRAVVQELAEAQTRTESRLDRLEAVVQELAEAQRRTEQRVEELAEAQRRTEQRVEELAEAQRRTEQRVEELAEAQRRTEQRVEELAEAQKRTESRLDRLEAVVQELAEAQRRTEEVVRQLLEFQVRTEKRLDRLETRMDALRGDQLERKYRERAYAYFGQILRGAQAIPLHDLATMLEERLSAEELEDLLLLDVLVRGRAGRQPDAPEVWLAMEVSAVVDRHDVERAQRRAARLRQAGYRAIPTVAGEEVTEVALTAAREGPVFLLLDGHRQFWDEALAEALAD